MSFKQFLVENSSAYSRFMQDYKNALGDEGLPSESKLLGLMNRRAYRAGNNKSLDFTTNWLVKNGFMKQVGGLVAPTPRGSSLRQALSTGGERTSDIKTAADGGFKKLRKYFQNVTDEATRDALSKLDEDTIKSLDDAKDITQEDIAILNGLRDRAEKHRERQSLIHAMMDKNPERLERLIQLGFINQKDYTFNKSNWDKFVSKISSLDPALIKALVPKFYEWSTHSSGNTARNINKILFAIHPESRNRTAKGEMVWEILNDLDDTIVTQIQAGKKPRQNNMSDEEYSLLTSVVASIIRTYPEIKTADELVSTLNDAFDSRVDFKSLDRSIDKTATRRQGVRDIFNR